MSMLQTTPPSLSSFGQLLRLWRRQRGLSQLALAELAYTTPRYISFIETGRSRPGRAFILRLARCMELPLHEQNELLTAVGFHPESVEPRLDDEQATAR